MTDIPAIGTVSRLSERALDSAVGGASLALDAARDQRATRRRGGRINAKVAATVESRVGEAITLPEPTTAAVLGAVTLFGMGQRRRQ